MLYNFSIHLYIAAINVASHWNAKAKAWVSGRDRWQQTLAAAMAKAGKRERLWIHCASLGEFEQGRPLIEAVRKNYPGTFILLSFFSPSGYEVRKHYEVADAVVYIPADTRSNAKQFLDLLQPDLAIFVKYEYWLNFLSEMHQRDVPLIMVSSIFREGQPFFQWWGGAWRKALAVIDHFFVQDPHSAKLLQQLGISHHTVAGDTRYDRVIDIARKFEEIQAIRQFCEGKRVIVAGSTWEKDELILQYFASRHPDVALVIAPHEIHEAHLRHIEKLFPGALRFSTLNNGTGTDASVIIIDNIGMLSRLYHYADLCYIGGGFGKGIHNVLEAAVHAKPVYFGPAFSKFREAKELIACGGAFSISDAAAFEEKASALLHDPLALQQASKAAGDHVKGHAGATQKIMDHIQEKRLLTN